MKKKSKNNIKLLYDPTEEILVEEKEALEHWYEEVLESYEEIDKGEVFDNYDD